MDYNNALTIDKKVVEKITSKIFSNLKIRAK